MLDVIAYWEDHGSALRDAIRESDLLCLIFSSSNVFALKQVCQRCGVYFDSICYEDMLFRLAKGYTGEDRETLKAFSFQAYQLYFSLVSHKSLFVNESEIPLAVVFPIDPSLHTEPVVKTLQDAALSKVLSFMAAALDEGWTQYGEMAWELSRRDFAATYRDFRRGPMGAALSEIEAGIPSEAGDPRTAEDRFNEFVFYTRAATGRVIKPTGAQSILTLVQRRFENLELGNLEAFALRAESLPEPHVHEFEKWGFERNAEDYQPFFRNSPDAAVARSLQLGELWWLEKLKIEDLIELRMNRRLDDLRRAFRVNAKRLKSAAVEDFQGVVGQIAQDLRETLARQREEVQDLRSLRRSRRVRVGSVSVSPLALHAPPLPSPRFCR